MGSLLAQEPAGQVVDEVQPVAGGAATDARMPLPVVMRLENERHQGKAWYFGAEQEIVQENVDGTVRAWGCGSVERADANLVDRTQFARDPRDRPSQHIRGP
jgi:hypothetical protein